MTSTKPGEVYLADFEEMEPHFVIVVSREELNRGKYVVVVVCTSRRLRERAQLPNCVFFRKGEFCFKEDCVAQAETISFIYATQILNLADGPLATLDEGAMRSVIRSIGDVLGSDCEPV